MRRRLAIGVVAVSIVASVLSVVGSIGAAQATVPPEGGDPDATVPATVPVDTAVPDTTPLDGAVPAAPIAGAPSAPLLQVPDGCPTPPSVAVVFVGTMLIKDHRTARFHVEQIRAGDATPYVVTDLIDVRYAGDVRFLHENERYLVGAAPVGANLVLTSKVREDKPLFGGNAVIGLTEKNATCPPIEDPVRTLHVDGTEVDSGLLNGLHGTSRSIALAFVKPFAVAMAILLTLVLLRWLFTAIFVALRKAAHSEPLRVRHTEVRRQIE